VDASLVLSLRRMLSLIVALTLSGGAWGEEVTVGNTAFQRRVEEALKDFAALPRPLEYIAKSREIDMGDHVSWLELRGETRRFAEKYDVRVLAYALWPMMDAKKGDADAVIVMFGKIKQYDASPDKLTYRSYADQGNWARLRDSYIDACKIAYRQALGQPDWWYPHPVLFDRDTVLADSASNAAVRSRYIAEMQKALVDPKIRAENPLEVSSILMTLFALNATEAAETFVDYMFYDWRAAHDYRLLEGDFGSPTNGLPGRPHSFYQVQVPCTLYLPRLGESCVPFVIKRFADGTPEERSVEIGGGALPAFAVYYFVLLHYTEAKAVDAITAYEHLHPELSARQLDALNEIVVAIEKKKYRSDRFLLSDDTVTRGWAPSATNSPSAR